MPYIKERAWIDKRLEPLLYEFEHDKDIRAGEVNYMITQILLAWLDAQGLSYATVNAIMGVLSCVASEFYRRVVAPYEDQKKGENGDVY